MGDWLVVHDTLSKPVQSDSFVLDVDRESLEYAQQTLDLNPDLAQRINLCEAEVEGEIIRPASQALEAQ